MINCSLYIMGKIMLILAHTPTLNRGCVEQQMHLIGLLEKQKNELADVNGKALQGSVNM